MSDGTIKRKLISWRNFERIYPFLFSVIGIITYFCIPKTPFVLSVTKKFTSTEFLNSYITVEATLFGFLLTVISIILQMNNKAVAQLKKINRFNELICFGRSAVVSSLILLVVAILIILLSDEPAATTPLYIFHYILGFCSIYNALATFRFTKIFFILSKY